MDPEPLVRGTDLRIRIRTKMSRIPNTVEKEDCGFGHTGPDLNLDLDPANDNKQDHDSAFENESDLT